MAMASVMKEAYHIAGCAVEILRRHLGSGMVKQFTIRFRERHETPVFPEAAGRAGTDLPRSR